MIEFAIAFILKHKRSGNFIKSEKINGSKALPN